MLELYLTSSASRQQSKLLSRNAGLEVKNCADSLLQFDIVGQIRAVPHITPSSVVNTITASSAVFSQYSTVWTKFVSCTVSSVKFHSTCPSTCLGLIVWSHCLACSEVHNEISHLTLWMKLKVRILLYRSVKETAVE